MSLSEPETLTSADREAARWFVGLPFDERKALVNWLYRVRHAEGMIEHAEALEAFPLEEG